MGEIFSKNLAYVKSEVQKEYRFMHALNLVEFDCVTMCPPSGQVKELETLSALFAYINKIRKSKEFEEALEAVYSHIDEADPLDKVLIRNLYRAYIHNKSILTKTDIDINDLKGKVFFTWSNCRVNGDATDYIESLSKLRDSLVEKFSHYERLPEEKDYSLYELMLGEFEEGMTTAKLDEMFATALTGINKLLSDVKKKGQELRTGFLTRAVVQSQQHEMADYILHLMEFDFNRGAMTDAKYPVMSILSGDDVRITSRENFDNFISEIYFIIHACGLALFEQMQPTEDDDYCISIYKTKGMKEAVAAFYENIIGKSREFIHIIYPKVCEIYPRVMRDVTESELYEAINAIEWTPVRIKADEATVILHGLVRYELEKEMIDGGLDMADLQKAWNEKYKKYLGIVPENDKEGLLQDMHWSRDFGMFPMYSLGNFYSAMILTRMKQDFDPFEDLEEYGFSRINEWMKDHVFKNANRLKASDWIKEICGKEACADDYVEYISEKYKELYRLGEDNDTVAKIQEYAARTERIRRLSSPSLSQLNTPYDYMELLNSNFIKIGELSKENRAFIKAFVEPIIESDEELSQETIDNIDLFYRSLISADSTKTLDIPIIFPLVDRMLEDAKKKGDDNYYVQQLDKQVENSYHMVNQTVRIIACPEIAERFREKGLKALDEILKYLDKDRFLKLDEGTREIVLINSRFGAALYDYEDDTPGADEGIKNRISIIEKSIELYYDQFYRNATPEYDWNRHLYRCYEYMLITEPVKVGSETAKYLMKYVDLLDKFIALNPEATEEYASEEYIELLKEYTKYRAGVLSHDEHLRKMLEIWENADEDIDGSRESMVCNVTSAASYIMVASRGKITEEIKANIFTMYRRIISYAFHMPKLGNFASNLGAFSEMLMEFCELPGGITFMQMGLNLMAAIHPPTYIHSVMVAKIANCLTGHLIPRHPELFVGCQGCNTREEVLEHKDAFLGFTYNAGLCHDFGKLVIIDTIYIYGRKLLDMEQEIIQSHAATGAELLSRYESTRAYVNVAKGHHRWYDGKGGYPDKFDSINNPCRTATAIVACADCMDTATDKVGRSYNEGIELEDYIKEVIEGSGTRYAPYMAELLQLPEVVEDMQYLLTEGRKKVYRDTYRLLSKVHVDARLY